MFIKSGNSIWIQNKDYKIYSRQIFITMTILVEVTPNMSRDVVFTRCASSVVNWVTSMHFPLLNVYSS